MTKVILKLVAFFGVCLLSTAWLVFTIGNVRLFSHNYELTATFDDVTGLLVNDNVKVAGVRVGKVTGIQIEKGRAKVTFTVDDDVKVPTDSTAAVRWRNLLGQRYLYVYPGEASTTAEDGGHLDRTQAVIDLGELFNRLGPIVQAVEPEKVNAFLDTIVAALDGNEIKLQQAFADLSTLTEGLASRDEAIGRLIENSATVTEAINARDQQIRTILDNLVEVATTFNEHTDVLEGATVELGRFSNSFGTLLADNRGQLDNTIANLDKLVAVVREKLPTLDHTLGALDEGLYAMFRSSMYGEWLNQTIPCGAIGANKEFHVNEPCVTGAEEGQLSASVATNGAVGLEALFGSLSGGGRP